jgi:hypothetical protein
MQSMYFLLDGLPRVTPLPLYLGTCAAESTEEFFLALHH